MSESNLEKILAFHELVMGKSDEYKKEKAKDFNIDFEEYKRRIKGKEKEAEFLIIMRSLRSVSHLVAYDESLSKITNEFTSDYEITFRDNYKILLEIKSSHELSKRIISGGNFEKRLDFAKSKNMPLRFAVCLGGHWGVYTSDYLKSKNFVLDYSDTMNEDNLKKSWLQSEFGTCSYAFFNKIEIISIYEKNTKKGLGIFFEDYGELIEYRILQDGKEVFKCNKNNSTNLFVSMCVEAIQDELSKDNHYVYKNGNKTKIIEFNTRKPLLIPEYRFILSRINHLSFGHDSRDDDLFFVAKSSQEEFNNYSVSYIRFALSTLVDKGLKVFVERDGLLYKFSQFSKTFWNVK
ncbi:MAG: hypothetical protein IJ247_04855 [Bacilli bacterium]|nr:hypothetical protein [Bacilli bacterium]